MTWIYILIYFVLLGLSLALLLLKMKDQNRFRWVHLLYCTPFVALALFGIAMFIMGMIVIFGGS